MNFKDLQAHRAELRELAEKRAGVLSLAKGVAKLPFRAAGAVAKAPFRAAGAAGKAGLRAGHNTLWSASKRVGGPLAPLMYGGAIVGTGAAGSAAISKAKEYQRGFDPRIQQLKARGLKV